MRFFPFLLIAFLVFSFQACQNKRLTSFSSEKQQQDLLSALKTFNQAFQNSDLPTILSMITPDYVHTNGNSKAIGKEQWGNYLRKRDLEIKSGKLEILDYKMEEIQVVHHADMAIVTAKVEVVSKREGEMRENEYRVTNIWTYEAGNWKRAGFHDGKIK